MPGRRDRAPIRKEGARLVVTFGRDVGVAAACFKAFQL